MTDQDCLLNVDESPGPCEPFVCVEYACLTAPVADDTACTVSDPCVLESSCQQGVCKPKQLMDCTDFDDVCLAGVCVEDELEAYCASQPLPNDTVCDDGDACTEPGLCAEGTCVSPPVDCSGKDGACVVGTCVGQGQCQAVPANNGEPCDDGAVCAGGQCVDLASPDDYVRRDGPCSRHARELLSGHGRARVSDGRDPR